MPDFTYKKYEQLICSLKAQEYTFLTFEQGLKTAEKKFIILRHDVDRLPKNALHVAKILHNCGVVGTFNFRITRGSFHPSIIEAIAQLGHEIGYHYEDLTLADGNYKKAVTLFKEHLQKFEPLYPVKTICMHGSPLSRWDNRDLWKQYDYKDYGIAGEPYFDIDYTDILYLTDTGRRWDGRLFNVRDKVHGALTSNYHSTQDILDDIEHLPSKLMINFHPQRWNDTFLPWISEFLLQNMKNLFKRYLIVRE